MFCESCGKNIPDDSKFCEYCGGEVTEWNHAPHIPEVNQQQSPYVAQQQNIPQENYYNPHAEVEQEIYQNNGKSSKPKLIKIIVILVVAAAILVGGFYIINKFLKERSKTESKVPDNISENQPENKPAVLENVFPPVDKPTVDEKVLPQVDKPSETSTIEIIDSDFDWYFDLEDIVIPEGGTALSYKDILGIWKLMAINFEAEPAEFYYSLGDFKEYSQNANDIEANTIVTLTHKYADYEGERFFYDETNSTDEVFCNFDGDILEMLFEEERVVDILFWEKDGKLYGQGHLFVDHDNDGFADLILSLAFTK